MSKKLWRDTQALIASLAKEHGAIVQFDDGSKHKVARVTTDDGRFFKLVMSMSPRCTDDTQLKVIKRNFLRKVAP